jgi:hypothetical protein
MSAQDPSDRTSGDVDPELSELALDADTSPASVLPTEANDESDQFIAHRRPTRAAVPSPSPPLVFGRFPVPSQQRVGVDQKGPPPGSRKQTTECGEHRSIGWPIPNTCMKLPFENAHLVPEHHDLDVLVRVGSSGRLHEAEDATQVVVRE